MAIRRSRDIFLLEYLIFSNVHLVLSWWSKSNKEAAAYISVTITFPVLLVILLYHVYAYTSLFSKVKETRFYRVLIGHTALKLKPRQHRNSPPPPDGVVHGTNDRFHQLDELLGPVNTEDYNILTVPLIDPVEIPPPTCSEVELPKLWLSHSQLKLLALILISWTNNLIINDCVKYWIVDNIIMIDIHRIMTLVFYHRYAKIYNY